MKLRNRKIIICTQCEKPYTIKAFRKLETTADARHLSACKSCDFAKGFVFDADRAMDFRFGNAEQFDALMQKTIEIDNAGSFANYNLLDVLETFGNSEHTIKAFSFALDFATLTVEEFQEAIEWSRQGKSFDAFYDLLCEKHAL